MPGGLTAWSLAVAAGIALAAIAYAGRAGNRRAPFGLLAAALRGIAATIIVALLLDAPVGRAATPRPLVALDASASWLRGGADAWTAARDAAGRLADGRPLLVGDSAREGEAPEFPGDLQSAVRPAVERALATGRPLVLFTDGELDDADVLDRLPAGSEVRVGRVTAVPDLALVGVSAPPAAVGGDTVPVRLQLRAGAAGAAAGRVRLLVDGDLLVTEPLDSLAAHEERGLDVAVTMPRREGAALLRAVVEAAGDREPRNDTVAVPLELSTVAGVTVVSTAPDFDVRYMLDVLRGTVSLPSRAYLQVAPGQWRLEGSLAPVAAETVRDAAARAPILVLHGDTTFAGRTGTGALLLAPAPAEGEAEWYAVAAPPSPLSPLLAGVRWDSLPPVAVGARAPSGEWNGLLARRGRDVEQRPLVAGREEPRRRVVVGAGGLWRWRFRGGAARDAYDALWGGIFDWLAAERRDLRPAVPEHGVLRAGERVRWRRGRADSVVAVSLVRRGATDTIRLELGFEDGASSTTSDPLPPGVYDVRVGDDGTAVMAVNASRELLPRRPSVREGPVGSGPVAAGVAPTARSLYWLYVLAALVLCAEWLVRRRAGMR